MEDQTQAPVKKVDLTRLNRSQRRQILKDIGLRISGRNLPYHKTEGVSLADFYTKREKEIQEDEKLLNK